MVFDPAGFVAEQVEAVRKQVGARTAVIAVSGGVDSTIAASTRGCILTGPGRRNRLSSASNGTNGPLWGRA